MPRLEAISRYGVRLAAPLLAALSLAALLLRGSAVAAAPGKEKHAAASRPATADGAKAPPVAPAPSPKLGDGLLVGVGPDAQCLPKCGFARLTDPDANGDLDGFGYEGQRTCIADGTEVALRSPLCDVVPLANPPPPGNGIFRGIAARNHVNSRQALQAHRPALLKRVAIHQHHSIRGPGAQRRTAIDPGERLGH